MIPVRSWGVKKVQKYAGSITVHSVIKRLIFSRSHQSKRLFCSEVHISVAVPEKECCFERATVIKQASSAHPG